MWKHKSKYKNKSFKGSYVFDKNKDRSFKLTFVGGTKAISFESHEKAKKEGFVKIK